MFRAYVQCLEGGKPPTYANLAAVLRRSRQSVWELFQRYPGLRPWLDKRCMEAQTAMLGGVLYRTGMLAMQGSDKHAELFLKHAAGAFVRGERGDGDGVGAVFNGSVTINNLVPRPDWPKLPKPVMPSLAAPTVDVPTVEVS